MVAASIARGVSLNDRYSRVFQYHSKNLPILSLAQPAQEISVLPTHPGREPGKQSVRVPMHNVP
jgi:hypothetical protein